MFWIERLADATADLRVNGTKRERCYLKPGDMLTLEAKQSTRLEVPGSKKGLAHKARLTTSTVSVPTLDAPVRLEVLSGESARQAFAVSAPNRIMGRERMDNRVVLPDAAVSSRQATLVQERGSWRINNLITTNPMKVNGAVVRRSYLRPGDEIKFGGVALRFEGIVTGKVDVPVL